MACVVVDVIRVFAGLVVARMRERTSFTAFNFLIPADDTATRFQVEQGTIGLYDEELKETKDIQKETNDTIVPWYCPEYCRGYGVYVYVWHHFLLFIGHPVDRMKT